MSVVAVTAAERWGSGLTALAILAFACWRVIRLQRRGEQPVDPLNVFLGGWGVALGLFALPFIRYTDGTAEVWIAVYGSIVTFSAGALFVARRTPLREDQRGGEHLRAGRLRLVWAVALTLGLLGFAMYVRAVDAVVGWRALFDDPELTRLIQTTSAEFDSVYGRWRLLTYFAQIAFLIWTVGIRTGAFAGRWRLVAPLGLLSVAPLAFTGERTLLATMLVWAFFFHVVWRPVRNWRRLIAGVVLAGLVLVTAFSALGGRVNKSIETHPEIAAHLESDVIRGRALEYVYITGNIPTLARLMDDPAAPRTFGAMTLLPGVKIINAAGLGGEPPEEVGAFYPIPFSTFNNYSWLGTFFLDFGLIGCLLLPLAFGMLFTYIARRVGPNPSFLGAWTLSLALYVVAFSPLLNKLSTTLTWQYALLGPVLAPFLAGRGGIRHYRNWLRWRRIPVVVGAAAVLVVLVPVATLATDNAGPPSDGEALLERLDAAAARIESVSTQPSALVDNSALASRLRAADPGMRFQGTFDFLQLPDSEGAINVHVASEDDVWLWGRATNGEVRGMHVILTGPWQGHHLLRASAPNLLDNGDLEAPLEQPWFSTATVGVEFSPDDKFSLTSDASLTMLGTGRRAGAGAFFTQVVEDLPDRAPGSVYTMRMRVYASGLDRPLPAAMKFTYSDGSTEFFQASQGTAALKEPPAILDGSDQFWDVATAIGRADKRLRSVQLFLVDTGPGRLRGRVWFDSVSLTPGMGVVRFPPSF